MNELHDYQLRKMAGLVYSGKDSDGDNEWIGTEKHWKKYKKLVQEETNQEEF